MTKRRLVLTSSALLAFFTVGALAACGTKDDSQSTAGRGLGCVGDNCYDIEASTPDDAGGGTDTSTGDGAVVYGNPLEGVNLSAALVKGGFVFTEGPVWAQGHLYFSDTGQNTIFRLESDAGATAYRNPSGGANGNAVDKQGRLVTCEGNRGRVTRTDTSLANPTAVADMYNGKAFDSPNDVIVRSDGTIYFTDPFYGTVPDGGLPQDKQAAYYVPANAPNAESAVRIGFTFNKANGIALSPDESTLYIVDNGTGQIMAAKLNGDGSINGTFTEFVAATGGDGMCVDLAGNVYVAATAGVLVFDATGQSLGTITVTGTPSNVAFGGSSAKELFITARTNGTSADPNTGIYSVTVNVPGPP